MTRNPVFLAGLVTATLIVIAGQACGRGGSLNRGGVDALSTRTCTLPAGVSGTPKTIEDVVSIVNALPKPVSLPCFVEVLARPLKVFASQSSGSAQPSTGPANPRFFIFSGNLILTVTSDGPGANLLEMSVLRPGNSISLKGELLFPVTAAISTAAPYDRIRNSGGGGTSCSSCHLGETIDSSITFTAAFTSAAFRALPVSEVDFATAKHEYDLCNPLNEPDRCLLLKTIFASGPVVRQDFPAGMQTP